VPGDVTPQAVRPQAIRDDFSPAERRGVYRAIHERRDIRSYFLRDPVPDAVLGRLLDAAHHAPSVGFMQPWDFIVIRDESIRRAVHGCFLEANLRAARTYVGEQHTLYESLKLEGILDAPVNICITCDRARSRGAGLGRHSDPATDIYSTVCAVQNLWLVARAESVGVGWVSIVDLERVRAVLEIPEAIVLVAYLCVGYVSEFPAKPQLEILGWESREQLAQLIHFDKWGRHDKQQSSALIEAASTGV
jgi:5,6-dimethylbenzimidazole synthase